MTMQMSRQTLEFPNDGQKTKFTMPVTWNCVTDIKTIDFDVVYNGDLFKCLGSDQKYVTVYTDDSPSIAQVHVENPTGSAMSLNFECNFSNSEHLKYMAYEQEVLLDQVTVVPSNENFAIKLTSVEGGYIVDAANS